MGADCPAQDSHTDSTRVTPHLCFRMVNVIKSSRSCHWLILNCSFERCSHVFTTGQLPLHQAISDPVLVETGFHLRGPSFPLSLPCWGGITCQVAWRSQHPAQHPSRDIGELCWHGGGRVFWSDWLEWSSYCPFAPHLWRECQGVGLVDISRLLASAPNLERGGKDNTERTYCYVVLGPSFSASPPFKIFYFVYSVQEF